MNVWKAHNYGEEDDFQNQVFLTKTQSFPDPNQVIFMPKPNQYT